METIVIKKVIGILHGIKIGTKSPADLLPWLQRLKQVNPYMYEDYLAKYRALVQDLESVK